MSNIYRRGKTFLITKDSQAIGVGILIKEKDWLAVRFPLPAGRQAWPES
jgi:hypothetical protein